MRLVALFCALSIWAISPALAQGPGNYRLLKLEGRLVKWGEALLGTKAVLTYAFVATPTRFDDARNCGSMTPLEGPLARSGVSIAAFEAEAAAAFDMWERAAGVSFYRIADPASADILIGADDAARGWAYADVLAAPSAGPVRNIERSLICLNGVKPWTIGLGGGQDLRHTLAHEIGHAIGLNHASPYGQIMSFAYEEAFGELQPGDVAGAKTLYGPPPLSNASVAAIPAPESH